MDNQNQVNQSPPPPMPTAQNHASFPMLPNPSGNNFLLIALVAIIAATIASGTTYFVLNSQKTNQPQPTPVVQTQPTSTNPEGKSCGGIAGEKGIWACPDGYYCKYPQPVYPDADGICVKK